MADSPVVDKILPTLTREELRALEDDPVIGLVEEDQWWTDLSEVERQSIRSAATRSLLARDLVWPTTDNRAATDPDLALLLNTRSAPTWLLALGERWLPGDGSSVPDSDAPRGAVLVCGTAEEDADNAVICAPVEGLYLNRLTTRELAVQAAADWMLRVPSDPDLVVQRTVDVLVPGLPRRHGLVMGVGKTDWVFTEVRPDGVDEDATPEPKDPEIVAAWLHTVLGGDA